MDTNKGYKLLVEMYTDWEGRYWKSREIGYFHTEENARKYANAFEKRKKEEGDSWLSYYTEDGHFVFTIEPIKFLD